MAEIETLGILDEIQALVSDKLQVVSYKWLSRNFLVPSNTAKRLLQELVEKNESQLEVIYTVSGWLKNNPEAYHIKLVLGSKLPETKEEFADGCSVQVYSVQTCIPKDPAVIWNSEFVQSEELFKEPPNAVNCLRDNRFCGVSNSFVKRNLEGTLISNTVPALKSVGIHGQSSRTSFSNQTSDTLIHQKKKVEQLDPIPKPAPQMPTNKKKAQNEKSSSLANMWGRASSKPKPESASVKTDKVAPVSNDAQVRANESIEDESSDDDDHQMNKKRGSNGEGNNRKRRVVMDYSDEDDEITDAVNLASPDPPKKQVAVDSKIKSQTSSVENMNLDFDEQKVEKVKVKEDKVSGIDPISLLKEESRVALNKNEFSDKDHSDQNEKPVGAGQNAPKQKKVLKTRIDERGREVTEVVWENDENETKPNDSIRKDQSDNNAANNAVNRPHAAAPKKSPAVGNPATGKPGNKKGATKDPKQGNIMSFFKKKG